ncbi:uncharacterized protein LOC115704779 [Cannabis sativa]|uniref:uncharacterized protein LOC115704779 n=1 Tax=Cannabis sativa TaxID=3483 RepID=UPI0011DF20C0|nr:uncharacterized protein LOC115704779 [Cannabis sativa]
MFNSKFLRVGIWMVKELSRGKTSIVGRDRYTQSRCCQFLQKLSENKVSRGAIFQKSCHFSSATDKNPLPEGSGQEEKISVTFVDKDGEEKHIKVPIGMSMLEAAHQNDIELEGACEGSLACSTCHVIVMDMEYYNKLEEPTDEENDMLDLAFALTETSRLGCQVIAKPELDGVRLAIPAATRNFAVDGYVPKPH